MLLGRQELEPLLQFDEFIERHHVDRTDRVDLPAQLRDLLLAGGGIESIPGSGPAGFPPRLVDRLGQLLPAALLDVRPVRGKPRRFDLALLPLHTRRIQRFAGGARLGLREADGLSQLGGRPLTGG